MADDGRGSCLLCCWLLAASSFWLLPAVCCCCWLGSRHEDCVIIISSKDSDNTISDVENARCQTASLILKDDDGNLEALKVGGGHVAATTIRLLIAGSQAGGLIGISGQNIEKPGISSGATITVLAQSQLPLCASAHESDRVVQEIGTHLRENPPKQVVQLNPTCNLAFNRPPQQYVDPISVRAMFEGLVRQLLVGYLGQYIKDIEKEQLRISLWNEEVLLENVELIPEAFDYLQLSFALKQGIDNGVTQRSSCRQRNLKVWLLPPFTYDYKSEKYSSPKDYYAGIRAEWAFRVTEQEGLSNDLRNFGAPVPHRRSLTMARRNVSDYEKAIKKANKRMLMRRCRHFMLQLATEMAEASNRDLTVIERNNVLNNEKYLSDYYIDSQFRKSHGNTEFINLPYSEHALILSVYADGLSSHVTCEHALTLLVYTDGLSSHVTWQSMATWFMGGSGNRRGGRNLQRGDSSRRGGGSGDAEDETPFTSLDASCAYHDRFGKRHFVMPKYYRDPCGLVENPSNNQTGYGLANARLLKWPALFIERVQMERLCRENRLKVPKARSVEIQKEDPDNVDRLCERLQREISQMGRRLARDMQLHIVKKDAQKNRTESNVVAIKGIMEDPELISDAELSDYSDSEPPADLSTN
ncbi:unnamed protein product [Camellia sinensis]